MAADAIGIPPRRRWPARVAGIIATAALLGIGVAVAVMVIPSAEEEQDAAPIRAAPAPTADPSPA